MLRATGVGSRELLTVGVVGGIAIALGGGTSLLSPRERGGPFVAPAPSARFEPCRTALEWSQARHPSSVLSTLAVRDPRRATTTCLCLQAAPIQAQTTHGSRTDG